jgi:hypothetical protein
MRDATPVNPIFFILSPGADPVEGVANIAKKQGYVVQRRLTSFRVASTFVLQCNTALMKCNLTIIIVLCNTTGRTTRAFCALRLVRARTSSPWRG